MNKIIRRFLGLAALASVGAALGNASTITYYIDVFGLGTAGITPLATASATLTNPNSSVNLSIPKLNQLSDPNPGFIYSLTAVNLALNWRAVGEVDTVNITAAPIAFTSAHTLVDLTLLAGGTQVVDTTSAGPVSGSSNCCFAVTQFPGLTGTGANNQNAANLAAFEGFGNSNFAASVTSGSFTATGTSVDLNAPGHLFFGGSGQMGAIAAFTFTYTEVASAVPEPLSFTLVGSSLIALGLFVRRKRSKRA